MNVSESGPVQVPARVLVGIDAVRESDQTNMLDVARVTMLARTFGYTKTADWVSRPENHAAYVMGVQHGFEGK